MWSPVETGEKGLDEAAGSGKCQEDRLHRVNSQGLVGLGRDQESCKGLASFLCVHVMPEQRGVLVEILSVGAGAVLDSCLLMGGTLFLPPGCFVQT